MIISKYEYKIRKKYFKKYKYLDDIFDDYYFGKEILRKQEYDIVFKKAIL